MTSLRDYQLKYQSKLGDKQDRYRPFRAVICAGDGDRTTGEIWRNENARIVYYQAWGTNNVGWALCDSIEPELNMGVFVQYNELINQYEVIRDDPLQRSTNSNRRSYRSLTNQDFEQGGRFQLWLDPTMIVPLSIYPSTAGLLINIVAGDYIYNNERKTYDGVVDYDISAEQPAGPNEHNLVGLYLDNSNALNVVTGAVQAIGIDAPEPAWPAGAFRLGVVDINDTQTDIAITDITNRKVVWTEDDGTLAFALNDLTDVTIAAPADNDILAYDTGTSEWINQAAADLDIALNDLSDVDTTGVADGDALVYDSGTSTWIPGSASGGVWPLAGHITMTSDGSDYTTVAGLFAALTGDEQSIFGQGEFACDNESVPQDSSYKGSGANDWGTVLATTTEQRLLTIDEKTAFFDGIKFSNTYDGNNIWTLYLDNLIGEVELTNCAVVAVAGASNAGVAIRVVTGTYTLTFRDCIISATGGATNTALFCGVSGASTINLIDCEIIGNVTAAASDITLNIDGGSIAGDLSVTDSTVSLINNPQITGTITGTLNGFYQNSSGDLLSITTDVYIANDEAGVAQRTNTNFRPVSYIEDDFIGSAFDGAWSFAGAPFTTPATQNFNIGSTVLIGHTSAVRIFLYRTDNFTNAQHYITASYNTPIDGGYFGFRFDDGSDNNYVESVIRKTTGTQTLELVSRVRSGGGAVTETVYQAIYDYPAWIDVGFRNTGTMWSSWNSIARIGFQTPATSSYTMATGLSWTPTRRGIVVSNNTTGSTSGPYVDKEMTF